jgi:hypothetical protein
MATEAVAEEYSHKGVEDNAAARTEPHHGSDEADASRVSASPDTAPAAPQVGAGGAKPNPNTPAKVGPSKEEKSAVKSKGKKAKAGSKYTFYVGPGNNGELVRATLEHRPWWELGKEDDPELNLKWLQVEIFILCIFLL